jgi:hypothetical protein
LPKFKGWRTLTSLTQFSFADLYPAASSQLINNPNAAFLEKGYDFYITAGSDWEALPAATFVLADQKTQGDYWDFGAIVNKQSGSNPTAPAAPTGLSVK